MFWKRQTKLNLSILMAAVAMLSVTMLVTLPLAADPPAGKGHGGGTEPVPPGPGVIAFNDYADFGASGIIALMNPDGSGYTPVADAGSGWVEPAWSPMFSDGTVKLSYPGYDSVTDSHLLMVVNVYPYIGDPVPMLQVVSTETSGGLFQADWSPSEVETLEDGTEIERVRVCYATFKTLMPEPTGVIHIVDLIYEGHTGTFTVDPAREPMVLDPGVPGSDYWQGCFSPDGEWLALGRGDTLEEGNPHKSIWLARADGTQQQPLIDEPGVYNWLPAWSPDGSQLGFISDRDGRPEIYVASMGDDVSVVSIERVTKSGGVSEGWPTWSPDGKQIAYWHRGTNPKIGKVLLATGGQFWVAGGAYPDWSPMKLGPLPWAAPDTPPEVSITNPVDGAVVESGAEILFEGMAVDPDDGADLTASLIWTSSLDGEIGTGGSFSTIVSDGVHAITASATDSAGNTGSAWIAISVQTPSASALNVTVDTDKDSYKLGETVYITVTVVDYLTSPVEAAAVHLNITTASGKRYVGDGTTDADGEAVFWLRKLKKPDGIGTYKVIATASKSGYDPGEGPTTFDVYR